MMHDKADKNIKRPNLFYTVGNVVFQWDAVYDVYFFFPPSWKHGKMHCNLLEHWWCYLSNSGQRIVSKVMKSFGIFFMFFLFLFFFLLVMRIDQPEWLIDSNNDNFSGELPMIQRICVNNKLILCIKSLTLWGCVSL